MDPFQLFEQWYTKESSESKLPLPAACCLSTLGLDGYPNARFVSLKEFVNNTFVVTGPLKSRKGREISHDPRVALTFWWPMTQRQVRIQGDASFLSEELANDFFAKRNRESQLVSTLFEQGELMESIEEMQRRFIKSKGDFSFDNIDKPKHWGGFIIQPRRIEFMEFKETRLHERRLFKVENDDWVMQVLQP